MNPTTFLPVTIELLVKSALISLAAALLARGWRDATSAQRHLVWLVALATVMLLPLTHLIAPQWAIPLQPAKKVTVTLPALPPVHVTTLEAISFPEPIPAPPAVRTLPDWRVLLLGAWLSGTVLLLGYRLFGSWRLHRLKRRSVPLDDPRVRLLLSRVLSELGLHRRPEIRLSQDCRVPITWGSLRPVMLLPTAALAWNDTWLMAALRHEAAHIRRYDYLTRWFAHVACAVYWPNPLVWVLARSLRVAQELAADDLVLRAGTPPEEYATQLVDAARNVVLQGFFVRQAVAMACPSTLEDRIRAIVDGHRDRRPLSRLAATAGSLAIALALGLSTAAQLRSDEQKPAPAPAADAPPAASAPTKRVTHGPQIEIESKFIEITTPPGKSPPPPPEKPTIYSDPQFQVVIRALNQKKGIDLLSAPRVTTGDNRQAIVEVGREFSYPIAWEKDGKKWKPTASENKKTGVTLDVTPRITPDGAIELHVVTTIVEFKGFVDLDNGGAASTKKKKGTTVESEYPPVPAGHRTKPVFVEQKLEKTVTLESDQTVELFIGERTDLQLVVDGKTSRNDVYRRQTFLFLSTRLIKTAPPKDAPKEGAAATPPAPANADTVLTVDKSGGVKRNGVPIDIDDLKTTLRALQASNPGASIVIRGGAETPYKTIMDLLDEIQRAGVTNVGLATPAAKAGAVATAQPAYLLGDIPGESTAGRAEGLLIKEWKLPPDMIPAKPGTDGLDRVSAKDWLIAKGVKFEDAATAVYVQANSRLIVRNTQAQLDLIDQVIEQINNGGAGAPGAAPAGANPGTVIVSGGTLVLKDGTKPDGVTVAGTGTLNITGVTTLNVANDAAKPATAVTLSGGTFVLKDGAKFDGVIVTGAANIEAADSPALAKAEKIVIPDFELREATLVDALDALRKQAVEFDPEKTGVKIVLKPGTVSDARITMSLKTIPVIEAMKYLTDLADVEFVVTAEALVVQPKGAGKAAPEPAPKGAEAQNRTGTLDGTLTFGANAAAESPALAKAEKIIIPKFEVREVSFADALDIVRKKAIESDPDKTGVKIVVKPGTVDDAKDLRMTLTLTNIPLIELMKYVTGLFNVEFVATPDALVVQPIAAGKAAPEPAREGAFPAAPPSPSNAGIILDGGTLTFTSPAPASAGATAPEKAKEGVEAELQRQREIAARNRERLEKDYQEHPKVPLASAQLAELQKLDKEREEQLKALLGAKATSGAAAESAALDKARRIIVPKIEFREAGVAEVLDFLRKKSAELDPDKTGVNVALHPGTTSDTRISLSLTDIPVIEAVRYLAGLANLQLQIEPNALILAPPAEKPAADLQLKMKPDVLILAPPAEKPPTDGAGPVKTKAEILHEQVNRLGEVAAESDRLRMKTFELRAQADALLDPGGKEPPKVEAPPRTEAGDLFLNAYLVLKKSEKLEAAGQIQDAIQQMQLAAQKFEELKKRYPAWQPQILEYRTKKVAEDLQRLQAKQQ